MLKKLSLSLLLLTANLFAMHEFELNLNNKDLDTHLSLDMGQFNDNLEPDNVFITGRFMIASPENAYLYDERDENMLGELGFLVKSTSTFAPGLSMGMGIKYAYAGQRSSASISALPIGIEADYVLPFDIPIPLHIGGLFYYAPQVLAFSGSTYYMEYEGSFDIELMERGLLTMGYRGIETPTEGFSRGYFNRSYFFGFKFKF